MLTCLGHLVPNLYKKSTGIYRVNIITMTLRIRLFLKQLVSLMFYFSHPFVFLHISVLIYSTIKTSLLPRATCTAEP